jgi:NAD(P)-dependent dehydrogenase (short-subunit alcohol dehydrogenase family)
MGMIRPIEVNLAGKTAIVTGANTGIGKEIARDLARLNARVILACRSEARGQAALDEIVADTGNHKTELRLVDVSSQASVLAFTADVLAREPELHILVNNAGVWLDEKRTSVDGIEMTWATNVLGPFLVTRELLPLLARTGDLRSSARIVNVASEMAHSLDLSDAARVRRNDRVRAEQAGRPHADLGAHAPDCVDVRHGQRDAPGLGGDGDHLA